jgi:hypothetical protein
MEEYPRKTLNKFQEEIVVKISNLSNTENLSVKKKLNIQTMSIQSSGFTGINEDVEKWLTYWEQKLSSTDVPSNMWPSMLEQHTTGLPLIWILRNKHRLTDWAIFRQEFMYMFKQSDNWIAELNSFREKTLHATDMIRIISILNTVFGERKVLNMFQCYTDRYGGYPKGKVFCPYEHLVGDKNRNTLKFLGYIMLGENYENVLFHAADMKTVLEKVCQNNWT